MSRRKNKRTAKGSGTEKDKTVDKASGANKNGVAQTAKCLTVAGKGIRTGSDFAAMMSSLMTDLIDGTIHPRTANAVCNAGGKLLKITEMQLKYGQPAEEPAPRSFKLIG